MKEDVGKKIGVEEGRLQKTKDAGRCKLDMPGRLHSHSGGVKDEG